ncbi:MAG: cytochrome c biogenesis CcdA family protein [Firmicutes bacterium]|nr:cytochrome c biogenesis CcdA family protein [Bacillota bacterium]
MQYFLTFLEGIITFVSPCILPMLPVYLTYFAGMDSDEGNKAVKNSLGFILGFTIVFVALGALAGSLGFFLKQHQTAVNIVTGFVVIFFGLSFMGVVKLPTFTGRNKLLSLAVKHNFWASVVFGVVFSIGWTPCVGAFLGSALMLAAQSGTYMKGIIMLLFYSLGLAIPFFLSALLIEKLKVGFDFIKRNYRVINIFSGALLVVLGVLMLAGRTTLGGI